MPELAPAGPALAQQTVRETLQNVKQQAMQMITPIYNPKVKRYQDPETGRFVANPNVERVEKPVGVEKKGKEVERVRKVELVQGGSKGTGEALGNKEVAVGEEIIAQRVLKAELDLTPKLTPYKSLSRGQQKKIKEKIENRTVTKEEYKRYQWDKRFSKRRAAGVNEFWKQEKKRILDGEPTTRDWTNEQIQEILRGKNPQYNGQSIIGHHTYNAMNYPHICNRGELIYPVTSREHLRGWHGGSYSKNAPGRPVNPNYLEEF